MTAKRRYSLIIEPIGTQPPPIVRLRRALKVLWRGFGLRCVKCREIEPKNAKAGDQAIRNHSAKGTRS